MEYLYEFGGQRYAIQIETTDGGFAVTVNGRTYQVKAALVRPGELDLEWDGLRHCVAYVAADRSNRWVAVRGGEVYRLTVPDARPGAWRGTGGGQAALEAQMPSTVRQVLVEAGQAVARGQALALLEAMKMEIRISAPEAGVVTRVAVTVGQTVERGQALFEIGPVPASGA